MLFCLTDTASRADGTSGSDDGLIVDNDRSLSEMPDSESRADDIHRNGAGVLVLPTNISISSEKVHELMEW